MPIHPLDGGRIATAVTRWLWLVGLIGGIIVVWYMESIIFFIIWALFAWELYTKYGKKQQDKAVHDAFTAEDSSRLLAVTRCVHSR